MARHVPADPYDFPYDGDMRPGNTALIVVDMQNDFLHPKGYFGSMGYDVTVFQKVIPPIRNVLSAARAKGYLVIHTRQGCRPDFADLPDVMRWRSKRGGAEFGTPGPMGKLLVRGERGHDIIPDLAPGPDEPIVDKLGSGAFYGTDLALILNSRHVRNIVLTGITTDVCVHSTLRTAIDSGYDCLLLEDCTAATMDSNYVAAISTIKQEGGYFGTVSTSRALIEAIS